jgi:hypothetical protein
MNALRRLALPLARLASGEALPSALQQLEPQVRAPQALEGSDLSPLRAAAIPAAPGSRHTSLG